jgi:AhpC/TSA family protein
MNVEKFVQNLVYYDRDMRYFRSLILFTILLLVATASAKDLSGAIKALSALPAAPSSFEPEILPPDGRPWVLIIFKTCCGSSDYAAKWMVETQKEFGDQIGIVGLNVDPAKSLQGVPHWLRRHKVKFPVVGDPTSQTSAKFGVISPPAIIILDGKGSEVYRTLGYQRSYGAHLTSEMEALVPL